MTSFTAWKLSKDSSRTYLLAVPDGKRKHIESCDNSFPSTVKASTLCGQVLEHYRVVKAVDGHKVAVCPACARAAL